MGKVVGRDQQMDTEYTTSVVVNGKKRKEQENEVEIRNPLIQDTS